MLKEPFLDQPDFFFFFDNDQPDQIHACTSQLYVDRTVWHMFLFKYEIRRLN